MPPGCWLQDNRWTLLSKHVTVIYFFRKSLASYTFTSSSSSPQVCFGNTPSRLCSCSKRRLSKKVAKNGIFPSQEDSVRGKMSQKQTHKRRRWVGGLGWVGGGVMGEEGVGGGRGWIHWSAAGIIRAEPWCIDPWKVKGQPAAWPGNPARRS